MTCSQIRLRLEVREPTMFSSAPGGGNSSSTLDFIPGVALRGALAGRYLRHHGVDAEFAGLFDGQLRFLDGRLVIGEQRSVPVPASARRIKPNSGRDDDQRFKDQLAEATTNEDRTGPQAEYKSYRGWVQRGTLASPDGDVGAVHVVFVGRTAMENGRAADGSLRFGTFLAPSSNQQFESLIVGPDHDLERLIRKLELSTGLRMRMGAGASVGGRVDLINPPGIEPFEPPLDDLVGAELVAVEFFSRTILVDDYLRYVQFPTPPTGWKLHTRNGRPWAYTSAEDVHGWNAAQGLPKSPDIALSGGSVVVLEREGPNAVVADLSKWVEQGVGLRTCEGFGEIGIRRMPEQTTTSTSGRGDVRDGDRQ